MLRIMSFSWILSFLLLNLACQKESSWKSKVNQEQGLASSPQNKSDRPQESGEGLPGYLIDPQLLTVKRVEDSWQIKGAARAVRDGEAQPFATEIYGIVVDKKASELILSSGTWSLEGEPRATTLSAKDGSFFLSARVTAGELLFVKIAAQDGKILRHRQGQTSAWILWINEGQAKVLDDAQAAIIEGTMSRKKKIESSSQTSSELSGAAAEARLRETGECRGCRLVAANLNGLSKPGCDLSQANLTGASLRGADLRSCRFNSANLTGADLSSSDLSQADFTAANTTGTDFRSANLDQVSGLSPSPE